ncbi:hypothetical protein HZB58_04770 [Candidatus Gottesmanbacteria bacterium]|nr:hypothetical protein [Candidatus Gottesmanbacteria bacterium]
MNDTALKRRIPAYIGVGLAILFATFLMAHTLSYNSTRHEIKIATKLWSDFGAHLPLVRSFSQGDNLNRIIRGQPVESPLFPGEPIRYHFGFYAIAGFLEKMGARIDWAINIPSIIGFAGLLIMTFLLSNVLFNNIRVSILSILFFLFNGSLSFARFFQNHPLSLMSPVDIITNNIFPAFGPWDNGNITAFWTLNIYTNQRHLAMSYGLLLILLYLLYKPARNMRITGLVAGAVVSMLLFINYAVASIAALWLSWIFISHKALRSGLLITAGMGLIAFVILNTLSNVSSVITWQPGYLAGQPLTLVSFITFWIENIGLHTMLMPLGILLSPRKVKKFLAPPLLIIFIVANLYKFSPDMINNHKYFNFFLIIGNMFTAYAMIKILSWCGHISVSMLKKPLQLFVGSALMVLLTLSGIIDFFPVFNDPKGAVADIRANHDAQFFADRTKKSDTVANTTWFYHPASIAGRPLLSGYTYFTWSYGYDQTTRETSLKRIYEAPDKQSLCTELKESGVSWIELNTQPESYLHPHWELWNSLPHVYINPSSLLKIYETERICSYDTP